jgi:hypothetical protein
MHDGDTASHGAAGGGSRRPARARAKHEDRTWMCGSGARRTPHMHARPHAVLPLLKWKQGTICSRWSHACVHRGPERVRADGPMATEG